MRDGPPAGTPGLTRPIAGPSGSCSGPVGGAALTWMAWDLVRQPCSRMAVRVINRQPFGGGVVVEVPVGRDQRQRAVFGRQALPLDFASGGELDGVVAQVCAVGQPRGVVEQGGCDGDDGVPPGEMLAEATNQRRCLAGGKCPALAAAGDGGRLGERGLRPGKGVCPP